MLTLLRETCQLTQTTEARHHSIQTLWTACLSITGEPTSDRLPELNRQKGELIFTFSQVHYEHKFTLHCQYLRRGGQRKENIAVTLHLLPTWNYSMCWVKVILHLAELERSPRPTYIHWGSSQAARSCDDEITAQEANNVCQRRSTSLDHASNSQTYLFISMQSARDPSVYRKKGTYI